MLYVKQNEIKRLWPIYKKNWWLFALSFLGCMAIAALFIFVKSKKFEVYTSVKITDGSVGSSMMATMAKNSGFGDILGMGGTEVDNEMTILESHHVIYNGVKKSGYNVSYSSRPFIKRVNYWEDKPIRLTAISPIYSDTLQEGLRWKIKISADGKKADVFCKTANHGTIIDQDNIALPAEINTDWGAFRLDTTCYFKTGESLTVKVDWYSYTAVAQSLMRDMEIGLVNKKADVIQLSYKDAIPTRCKQLLNAIIDSYEQYSLEAKDKASEISMDFLQRRIDTVNHQLADLEAQIENYKLSHKLSDVEIQAQLALEKSSSLEEELTQLELIIGNVTELEKYLDNPEHKLDPLPIVTTGSEEAASAIMDYNTALTKYLDLKRMVTPSNPTFISAQQSIESSRDALRLTIRTIKENAQSNLQKLNAKNQQLQGMVGTIPTVEREYVDLKRQQELKQKIYVMLLAQQEQNALTLSNDQPKSQLVDEAYANVRPSGPKGIIILIVALFFALFLPIAWLRFLDMLNPYLQTPEQLKNLEGFNGDIHTIRANNDLDIKQLALEMATKAQQKDLRVVMIEMQNDENAESLALQLRQSLDTLMPAHQIEIVETPAFTEKSDAMYSLTDADAALLVTRQGVTRRSNLPYIETLLDKHLLSNLLTAYQC